MSYLDYLNDSIEVEKIHETAFKDRENNMPINQKYKSLEQELSDTQTIKLRVIDILRKTLGYSDIKKVAGKLSILDFTNFLEQNDELKSFLTYHKRFFEFMKGVDLSLLSVSDISRYWDLFKTNEVQKIVNIDPNFKERDIPFDEEVDMDPSIQQKLNDYENTLSADQRRQLDLLSEQEKRKEIYRQYVIKYGDMRLKEAYEPQNPANEALNTKLKQTIYIDHDLNRDNVDAFLASGNQLPIQMLETGANNFYSMNTFRNNIETIFSLPERRNRNIHMPTMNKKLEIVFQYEAGRRLQNPEFSFDIDDLLNERIRKQVYTYILKTPDDDLRRIFNFANALYMYAGIQNTTWVEDDYDSISDENVLNLSKGNISQLLSPSSFSKPPKKSKTPKKSQSTSLFSPTPQKGQPIIPSALTPTPSQDIVIPESISQREVFFGPDLKQQQTSSKKGKKSSAKKAEERFLKPTDIAESVQSTALTKLYDFLISPFESLDRKSKVIKDVSNFVLDRLSNKSATNDEKGLATFLTMFYKIGIDEVQKLKSSSAIAKNQIETLNKLRYEVTNQDIGVYLNRAFGLTEIAPARRLFQEGSGIRIGSHRQVKIGRGLPSNERDRFIQFGKYFIHTPSLEQNKLSIRYPSLAIFYKIKPRDVSNVFKHFLLDALDNHVIDKKLFSTLSKPEKDFFTQLCKVCKISFDFDDDELFKEKIKRFELLKGEILAGNDNRQLLKQLREYIKDFVDDGIITKTTGMNLLQEISVI